MFEKSSCENTSVRHLTVNTVVSAYMFIRMFVCLYYICFDFYMFVCFTFLYVGISVSSLSLARPVCFVCVGVYVLFTCGHTNKLHSASACGLLTMDINTLGTLVKKKSLQTETNSFLKQHVGQIDDSGLKSSDYFFSI